MLSYQTTGTEETLAAEKCHDLEPGAKPAHRRSTSGGPGRISLTGRREPLAAYRSMEDGVHLAGQIYGFKRLLEESHR